MAIVKQPSIVHPAGTDWVLVKGNADSDRVEAVYGPYTEQQADWLMGSFTEGSIYRWTKAQLQTGPESA